MPLKQIQYNAKYNNYIMELLELTEESVTDMHGFVRLLAMETDYKDWVQQQLAEKPNEPVPFLSEAMLSLAEDAQVRMLCELRDEMEELLHYLHIYMMDTDELKVEFN